MKSISGTPEEVMQGLADEISDLRIMMNKMGHQLLAQQHALHVLFVASRMSDAVAHVEAVKMLETIRDGHRESAEDVHSDLSASDQQNVRQAFQTMAEQLDAILKLHASPGFSPVVIEGGKTD